jgi:hypothetical protein
MLEQADLHTYAAGRAITIGPFSIGPRHVCHSIPGSVGLGITTPAGLIAHSGDFKFDDKPVDGWPTGQAKLAEFSSRGVLGLLSDSTNADRPGSAPFEAPWTLPSTRSCAKRREDRRAAAHHHAWLRLCTWCVGAVGPGRRSGPRHRAGQTGHRPGQGGSKHRTGAVQLILSGDQAQAGGDSGVDGSVTVHQ